MPSILEGSLATEIGAALSFIFMDATLTRDTTGTPTEPGEPGPVTSVSYPCKAIHEEWNTSYLSGGLVVSGDRKILILAVSLAVTPIPRDRITIRGETFTVVPGETSGQPAVSTDPAKATWSLRARV